MSSNSALTCNGLEMSTICETRSMVLSLLGSIRHCADMFSFSPPHKLFYPHLSLQCGLAFCTVLAFN